MTIRELNSSDKEIYNNLANHPIQSWEWGEFKEKSGNIVKRWGVFNNENKLSSVFQVFYRKIPKTNLTVANCSKCSLPEKTIVEKIKEESRKQKTVFVKFEPDFIQKKWENIKGEIQPEPEVLKEIDLKNLGLKKAKKALFSQYSFVLNLNKSEEDLLSAMEKRTRYNIHLAQKSGVVVEEATNESGLEEFIKLFEQTQKRAKFYMHAPAYFKDMFKILASAGIIKILLAKYHGQVLNAKILFIWKNRLFCPYGASSKEFLNLKAANLIYWEIIRFGKKIGCESFDMWAGLGPKKNSKHPWQGFHDFKTGYAPDLVEYVGSWDLVLKGFLYYGFNMANSIRWGILKIKR